jgi:hypothetical protein
MKRVLMYWLVGDRLDRYTFISRISEDYVIPKFTDEVYFMEGRIIDGDSMNNYTIELTLRGEILAHSRGREFIMLY